MGSIQVTGQPLPTNARSGAFVHSVRTARTAHILQGEIGDFATIGNIPAYLDHTRSVGLMQLLPTDLNLCKMQKNVCIGMWVMTTFFGIFGFGVTQCSAIGKDPNDITLYQLYVCNEVCE